MICYKSKNKLKKGEQNVGSVFTPNDGFEYVFPNAVGCIDGTHIPILAPKHLATDYYNYKGWHSMLSLAICDSNCRVYWIKSGLPGRCNDSGAFNETRLCQEFKDLIPQQRRLICGEAIPYFLLGDSAFKLTSWMMKPFQTTSNADQVLFNRKHTLARRSIERTFGMVKSRFRRLLYCLHVRIDRVANVVDSAFTLHNICLAFSDSVPAESSSSSTSAIRSDSASSLASTPPSSMLTSSATSTNNVERLEAIAIRNALKEYFVQNSQRNQIVEDDDDEDEDVDE